MKEITFDMAQSDDFNKLKTKTFDDMSEIKDDSPERVHVKKYPLIANMVCDVIHKNKRVSIKSIQLNAVTLGTSKIESDPRIATMRMKYESILSHIENDDDLKTYSIMRNETSYIYNTSATTNRGINLSLSSRDVSILSDISKYMGIYPHGMFVVAFLIGVRDASCLNTYQVSKIDKEISSFWQDVDRRIIYLSSMITQKTSDDKTIMNT